MNTNYFEYDSKFKSSSLESMLSVIYENYNCIFEQLRERTGEFLRETIIMIMNFLDVNFNVRIKVQTDTLNNAFQVSTQLKDQVTMHNHTIHLTDPLPSDVKFIIELQGLSFFYNLHEDACVFYVSKRSYKAFVGLNYGLRLFQNIRGEICKQLKIKNEKCHLSSLSPVQDSWLTMDFETLRKHIVCHSILRKKPEEVDVLTEEFGPLSSPTLDDIEQFVEHHLSYAHIRCPKKFRL
jgi:hypothetical protein